MKKFSAILLALCLLLCLCAGCAGGKDPGGSSEAEAPESSAPSAEDNAGKAEQPADGGAVWSVSLRELMGKPVKARNIALAGNGVVYVILKEVNEYNIDITRPYLVSYDPASGEMSQVGWDADYIGRFAVLEDGRIGALADPGDGLRLMRFALASDMSDISPVISTSDGETAVAAGYDAYCCNDETGDLVLYDAAGEATVVCPGGGGGSRNAIAYYLSPDGRYVVYLKFQGGLLDVDTAWIYDALTGEERAYSFPAVETTSRPSRAMAGVGDAVFFFENQGREEPFSDRCWRVKDGGELEELTLPFRYRNGNSPMAAGDAILFADGDENEPSPVYLLHEDGTVSLADYALPAEHYLAAAVSGERLVLSVYEGGRDVGDSVYYLIETGFSKIG